MISTSFRFTIYLGTFKMYHICLNLIIPFLIFSSCSGTTTSKTASENLKEQINLMCNHMLEKDYEKFVKFVHPKVIEQMGGTETLVEIMRDGELEMKLDGVEFLNITVDEPSSIIKVGNEMQAYVTQKTEMKVKDGKILIEATVLAFSDDQGDNWYFLDASTVSLQQIKKVHPTLSDQIVISEKKTSVFVHD